jgi:hypothetical protein
VQAEREERGQEAREVLEAVRRHAAMEFRHVQQRAVRPDVEEVLNDSVGAADVWARSVRD